MNKNFISDGDIFFTVHTITNTLKLQHCPVLYKSTHKTKQNKTKQNKTKYTRQMQLPVAFKKGIGHHPDTHEEHKRVN
jgi:hypothetical protein